MVKKNKILASLLLFASVICFSIVPVKTNASEVQVYDNASVISDSDEQRISKYINSVETVTGWDLMAVTTNDTNGKSTTAYSDDFFESHSDAYSGVACVLDMDSRTMHISTFGEAITYLTDARLDDILDYAYEDANGDYGEMLYDMVYGIESMYEDGIPSGGSSGHSSGFGITFKDILISIIASVVVGIVVSVSIIGKYKMHWGLTKYAVRDNSSLNLTEKRDILIDTDVTKRRIQSSSSGGSSGGSRSSTHRTSSGRTAGGRSKSF